MPALTITNDNFKTEVLSCEKPVLVDFWASWCGPCRMLMPRIEEIADEQTAVKVAKANVDECGELAATYGVSSVPTLILFKGGKPVVQMLGAQPKDAVLKMMQG